jgi:hypothetical protein
LLRGVLSDDDPTPEYERKYGGENMDPPTLAINSTRGKALRAALDLLAQCWDKGGLEAQRSALEDVVGDVAANEVSPGVRSVFGIYLPLLLTKGVEGITDVVDELLPVGDEKAPAWESVFTSFMLFRPAFRGLAELLKPQYRLAVDRLRHDEFAFLHKNADRLIVHLVSLSLEEDSEGEWFELLEDALGAASDEASGGGLAPVAHAALRSTITLEPEWVLGLIESRLRGLSTNQPPGNAELSALLEILLATPSNVGATGTHGLALLAAGARVDINDVTRYLRAFDDPPSAIGADLLADAVHRAVESDPWFADEDELRTEVRRYTAGGRGPEMWRLVNLLGSSRRFFVEPEALELRSQFAAASMD